MADDKQKVVTDRGPAGGADRDRKSEKDDPARRGEPARGDDHAVGTPAPTGQRGDTDRGGEGQDAHVSERNQDQGARTREAERTTGEPGYAQSDNVPRR